MARQVAQTRAVKKIEQYENPDNDYVANLEDIQEDVNASIEDFVAPITSQDRVKLSNKKAILDMSNEDPLSDIKDIEGDEQSTELNSVDVLDEGEKRRYVEPSGADDYAERVLSAWIASEVITPIKSSSLTTIIDGRTDASLMPLYDQGKLPWEDGYPHEYAEQSSGYHGYRFYDVVLGHIDLAEAEARFVEKYGRDQSGESRFTSGVALLATLRITKDGYIAKKKRSGLDVSSFGWGMIKSLSGDLSELAKWKSEKQRISSDFFLKFEDYFEYDEEKEDEVRTPMQVTLEVLQDIYYMVLDSVGAGEGIVSRPAHKDDLIKRPAVVAGHWFELAKEYTASNGAKRKTEPKNDEADAIITNSFFLNDLIAAKAMLCADANSFPPLLKRYLGIIKPAEQINILKNKQHLGELLKPENFPLGKWPVLGRHSLVSMQQAVVNYASSNPDREDDAYGKFVVVNGPPGTGKTTSFKDFVASQIVKRARAIIDVQKSGSVFVYDRKESMTVLNKSLRGFEMVVTSSNNGAVENVSSEWPAKSAVAEDSALEYFPGLAQSMYGENSWGTVSAVLGNKSNRARFYKSVWMDTERGLSNQLLYAAGNPLKKNKTSSEKDEPFEFIKLDKPPCGKHEALKQWDAAQHKFMRLYAETTAALKEASERSFGKKLPFDDYETFQRMSPWLNASENKLREDLFEAAFEVHRAFIYVNAAAFQSHFANVLMNLRSKGLQTQNSLAILSLAFPVVSTTFASFDRMFGEMPTGSIGWLLIDEAGQATPQSAVGALSRSKNVMIVGDPLQVPPVVTLNEKLIQGIYEAFDIDKSMMAPEASVQTIADSASEYCAEYKLGESEKRRVGMPFLVHRRCAEPMFSISNHTAYGGMMVHATQKRSSKVGDALKHSRWISVVDPANSSKWSVEEGKIAMKLLRVVIKNDGLEDFYIVTPFRDVENLMRSAISGNGAWLGLTNAQVRVAQNRVGTIHKVQGREADTVIMLLGAQGEKHKRARQWAGGIPNLLNVAASRAKSNLYVVGNRSEWRSCGYFSALDHYIDITRHLEDRNDCSPST